MKIKKSISVLLSGVLMSGMLVGCSSEFDSTEYLDEDGKKLIEKYEDREKYDYIKVESLEPFVSEDMYKDKYIMITGKVTSISEEGLACYELGFDFEENHTANIIRVFVLKNTIDVKFKKGDTITVYGKCNGIKTKRYGDKSFDYWHIFANFLELGDTTDEEKSIKKDDVEAKSNEAKEEVEDKKVETAKDKEEEKAPSQDNNKSNEKQIDTKKDNDNDTKEKPKKKDTNTKKDTKEEHKGYYVTCPNGHKIYTENGDWDCIECDDDWQEQEEADDSDYEYEDGYIKDGTHLGENNPDESIEVIEDPEYYE